MATFGLSSFIGLERYGNLLVSQNSGERLGRLLPRLPAEEVQRRYTGQSGDKLMARSVHFASYVAATTGLARNPDWRGLDYGVGWGRLVHMMLKFGGPQQLDCCDAWAQSLENARATNLRNRMFQVPGTLTDHSIPPATYDFIYAFSIFTHLPDAIARQNIAVLMRALKPNGRLIITVRPPTFLQVLKGAGQKVEEMTGESLFIASNSESYGEFIVTPKWLEGLGHTIAACSLNAIDPQQAYVCFANACSRHP